MAEEAKGFEAMVLPRGARIIAGDGRQIELDVQGDLILQENQRGLSALKSHHGSILIDKDVTIRSESISAKKMIRVRGNLESDEVHAASVFVEGGELRCGELHADNVNSKVGKLEARSVHAKQVRISSGEVEIGAVFADSLNMSDGVRGAVMITEVKDLRMDESVQLKGRFDSDVELLGYLLKFRHQFMSHRVLEELKTRKNGRDFKRFLLREAEAQPEASEAPQPADENYFEMEETATEESPEEPELTVAPEENPEYGQEAEEAEPEPVDDEARLSKILDKLMAAIPSEGERPDIIDRIIVSLYEGSVPGLLSVLSGEADKIEEAVQKLPEEVKGIIEDLRTFLESHQENG
jgi:cytoskeletal protein CcmA (bactofilin family)